MKINRIVIFYLIIRYKRSMDIMQIIDKSTVVSNDMIKETIKRIKDYLRDICIGTKKVFNEETLQYIIPFFIDVNPVKLAIKDFSIFCSIINGFVNNSEDLSLFIEVCKTYKHEVYNIFHELIEQLVFFYSSTYTAEQIKRSLNKDHMLRDLLKVLLIKEINEIGYNVTVPVRTFMCNYGIIGKLILLFNKIYRHIYDIKYIYTNDDICDTPNTIEILKILQYKHFEEDDQYGFVLGYRFEFIDEERRKKQDEDEQSISRLGCCVEFKNEEERNKQGKE